MLCLAEDVRTVVDAVEVDPFAVIAHPIMGRRREPDHRRKCCPGVNMRHHFGITCVRRDVVRPPHQARNAKAAFEWCAFFAAERHGSRVGPGILPGTVIGRHDDDRVGRLRTNGIRDTANVVIQFQHGV